MRHPFCSWLKLALCALALAAPALAQTYSLTPPTVGSGNVADADPPVLRPTTQPCRVQLFSNLQSGGSTQNFTYAPPADCPGPWSKVVFNGDFTATGTNQFDRTAEIQLGDVMIYYGTTQEPSPTEQPTWHVESDLTDYTALFKTSQPGTFELANYIEGPYCCYQTASAYLEFYPANFRNPAPRTADQVLPLPQTAGSQQLSTPTSTISETFNLPANVEEAYLDVFTQGQQTDEFWWSCIPNDALTALAATNPCGNTAFRQAAITIDGKPAGIAPIYPYVFTGGFDPYDWRPIPGIQTLNFKPYRVNLTPFAAELDNGSPHTVAVSVYNANNYFLADATLLLFQDHHSQKVTGALTTNTLTATPAPSIQENLAGFATNGKASIATEDAQSYKVSGYLNTSHGKVETTVDSSLTFTNEQVITNAGNAQTWAQLTHANRKTTTREGFLSTEKTDNLTFPLNVNYAFIQNADGTGSQTVGFDQKLSEYKSESLLGFLLYESSMTDHVQPTDTLTFDASFNLTGAPVNHSAETYTFTDSYGHCWDRTVKAQNELVSAVSDGQNCRGGVNHWQ